MKAKRYIKKPKKKLKVKRIIFILLIILLIVFSIFTINRNKNSKPENNVSSTIIKNNIEFQTVSNDKNKLSEKKLVEGNEALELSGLNVLISNNYSTIETTITNLSLEPQNNIYLEIIILDNNSNILTSIENVPFSLNSQEKYKSNSIIKSNLSNAYDYTVKIKQ